MLKTFVQTLHFYVAGTGGMNLLSRSAPYAQ
jgi:hypothetical protein